MPPKNPKFDLRMKYQRVFEISIILSILLILTAFTYFPRIEREAIVLEEKQELINLDDVILTDSKPEPPPPPKPVIPIESPVDEDLEDVEIDETDLIEDDSVRKDPPAYFDDDNTDEYEIFYALEDMPEIIGGLKSLQNSVVYPDLAVRSRIQGKVIVQALIDKEGNVESASILKGIGAGCDEAAVTAVMNTKFIPGKQRGKAVRVYVSVPIMFKLN